MYYVIVSVIWGIIWGVATRSVILNKGYTDEGSKWFWLGFFFTFIAIIVAATKPAYHPITLASYESRKREQEQQLLENGGWRCDCGRVNANYVSSCACGKSKSEWERKKVRQSSSMEKTQKSDADQIKQFKSLLDDGVITQEEFEAKKKQLLGL